MDNKTFRGTPTLLSQREEGKETIRLFDEEIEIWPKFCKRIRCVQCIVEGKIQCDPHFRQG